ncbi:MAG: creatininase family protein, partial [Clostridia bacterium]|nr:creatininase family protein [Clostridia bacterium]
MYLDYSFPKELKNAQEKRTPLVIVGGTVEYHGPHCSYGCDTLIAQGLLEKLAEKKEILIAPSISYSPASWAVGNDKSGTVHVRERAFEDYLYYVFKSLLTAGNRN